MKKNSIENILQRIAIIIIMGIFIISLIIFKINDIALGDIIFYDVIPLYSTFKDLRIVNQTEHSDKDFDVYNQGEDEQNLDLVGIDDIDFESKEQQTHLDLDTNSLYDLNYLKQKFYIVDKKTDITTDYFNIEKFLTADLSINKSKKEPKVLIFHTHSKEMFADSNTSNINDGIVGAGARLKTMLEENYGIKTLHITESFDVVDGKTKISGAYERMEPVITKILEENPSIELVLDLHRDGVAENTKLVTEINGKATAKIMYFNGICRLYENGVLNDIYNLENPYIETNLALSFNMQKLTLEKYPSISRKIYINAYRYSLHMLPKSMLIEVGAQTNTKEEIYNAIDILAELINEAIFE